MLRGFVLRVRQSVNHSYYATRGRGRWHLVGGAARLRNVFGASLNSLTLDEIARAEI